VSYLSRALKCLWILLLFATGLATFLGFAGSLWWIADLFSHFRAGYVVLLVLGMLFLAGKKHWWWALACLVLAALNAYLLVPFFQTPAAPNTDGPELRVIAWNAGMTQSSPELIRLIEDTKPDVVLLSELSPELDVYLRSHLPDYRPTAIPLRGTFGIGGYTNAEVLKGVTPDVLGLPTVELTIKKSGIVFYLMGIHGVPPMSAALSARRDRFLVEINRWVESMRGRHIVVAGDFSTTPWSHAFRSLVNEAQLENSQHGHGIWGTWPAFLGPISLPVDHLLHSQSLITLSHSVGPSLGSRHYPIQVVLKPRVDGTVVAMGSSR
jgi:endonuclease/exonuclease/phosphatase (EEP) superfamily protein YafD